MKLRLLLQEFHKSAKYRNNLSQVAELDTELELLRIGLGRSAQNDSRPPGSRREAA